TVGGARTVGGAKNGGRGPRGAGPRGAGRGAVQDGRRVGVPGVRLLTVGDANGEIQRHQEQQPLRLEVRTGPDSAAIALYGHEDLCVFKCSVSRDTECSRVGKQSFIITLGCNSVLLQFGTPNGTETPKILPKSTLGPPKSSSKFTEKPRKFRAKFAKNS
uniref:Uncharacterized protein n=1 Tax=Catharus ustulatus TaxID=91951 RepID=A0A8C3Y4V1_CATUS